MPLKLSIAMSRKVGEPNYGSRGATVGLEIDVDSSLVDQPQQFHERIDRLFRLAAESVNRELALSCPRRAENTVSNGDGQRPAVRPATPAQIRAVYALANCRQVDLTAKLRGRFGIDQPDDLTIEEASTLIDDLKAHHNGAASD